MNEKFDLSGDVWEVKVIEGRITLIYHIVSKIKAKYLYHVQEKSNLMCHCGDAIDNSEIPIIMHLVSDHNFPLDLANAKDKKRIHQLIVATDALDKSEKRMNEKFDLEKLMGNTKR